MITRCLRPTALLIAISTSLLAGCAGGGGTGGFVRPTQDSTFNSQLHAAATSTQEESTSTAPLGSCQAPANEDCVVTVPFAGNEDMTGGRQSDHALVKQGNGTLTLAFKSSNYVGSSPSVDFQFADGVSVEDGILRLYDDASLHADVSVKQGGSFRAYGPMIGNLENHGYTLIWGGITGDVMNDGLLEPSSTIWGETFAAWVTGNFRQTADGTLRAIIGVGDAGLTMTGGYLSVTGRADIAGKLELAHYTDDWGPYLLPTAPFSVHVLHADGGIFGQFAQWTTGTNPASSLTLLLTGELRYLTDDVYFDVATASAEGVMANAGAGDALTARSAGHFDAALAHAGEWATAGAKLSATQQRFLGSVGAIQHLQDYDQAIKVFDSLSGHGYSGAADALLQQASLPGADLMSRISDLQPGATPTSWATHATTLASGAATFRGDYAGFDQWIGNRLLLGGSFGLSQGDLRFDRSGGTARDQSPQWDVYLRHNGNAGSYLFGDVGYSSHQLDLSRQIDLGATRYTAGARQSLNVMRAYFEAGKDFRVGATRLTPFGALSYAVVHGSGFVEHGGTGFELVAQPSVHQRVNAAAGLRLGTRWLSSSGHWTQWNVTAGYRRLIDARDDAHAAFLGAPQATFALDGLPHQSHSGWVQMNLSSGGKDWNWLMSYDRQAGDQALSLGAHLAF